MANLNYHDKGHLINVVTLKCNRSRQCSRMKKIAKGLDNESLLLDFFSYHDRTEKRVDCKYLPLSHTKP